METPTTDQQAVRSPDRPYKHPGKILKAMYLAPLELSVKDFALMLDMHEKTVSNILNGKARITTETALKLSKLFRTSAELWMNMQVKYDLWHKSREMDLDKYKPLEW